VRVKGNFNHCNGIRLIEKHILWRGSHSFLATVDCLVDASKEVTLPVANPSSLPRMVCWGEVLGCMLDPSDCFKEKLKTSLEDKELFEQRALFLKTLIEGSLGKRDLNHMSPESCMSNPIGIAAEEALGPDLNGPKTAEPSSVDKMKSQDLEELIDVDPSLTSEQWEQVYKVLRSHKLAFGFDG
jgi:hypothetical protein